VLCARAGALPEVCGDAALYFDPLETESITDALKLALSDSTLREELSNAGRKRAQMFSWRHAAEETLAVYRAAIQPAGMRETKQ
jgi:glycosyltransferase involved in cell wall biosynthesis